MNVCKEGVCLGGKCLVMKFFIRERQCNVFIFSKSEVPEDKIPCFIQTWVFDYFYIIDITMKGRKIFH